MRTKKDKRTGAIRRDRYKPYPKSNKAQWELENIAHLNSIQDEQDGGNRGITYGRSI